MLLPLMQVIVVFLLRIVALGEGLEEIVDSVVAFVTGVTVGVAAITDSLIGNLVEVITLPVESRTDKIQFIPFLNPVTVIMPSLLIATNPGELTFKEIPCPEV